MPAAVPLTPTILSRNARQAGCLRSQARDYITGVFLLLLLLIRGSWL